MIPNPIRKVLSSMREYRVRVLLMGGQACVFYGGAELNPDGSLNRSCASAPSVASREADILACMFSGRLNIMQKRF